LIYRIHTPVYFGFGLVYFGLRLVYFGLGLVYFGLGPVFFSPWAGNRSEVI
jgi:hypothetical protein